MLMEGDSRWWAQPINKKSLKILLLWIAMISYVNLQASSDSIDLNLLKSMLLMVGWSHNKVTLKAFNAWDCIVIF